MDNKLRIERVKEGIKLLEEGIDPTFQRTSDGVLFASDSSLELSPKGDELLLVNIATEDAICNGFKSSHMFDTVIMLHNWKRFLELIENL